MKMFIAARVRNSRTSEEHGQKLRRYWTDACGSCPIRGQCTTGKQRRITRWEHEEVVEAVQERLDNNPDAMRTRRETVGASSACITAEIGKKCLQPILALRLHCNQGQLNEPTCALSHDQDPMQTIAPHLFAEPSAGAIPLFMLVGTASSKM